jgi:imidazolonepropionase
MSILITGLDQIITFKKADAPLTGRAMRDINIIKSGAILIDGKKIVAIGKEREVKKHELSKKAKHIKMRGVALPGFVDSHTHAIFAEPRLKDFSLRVKGASYQEIKDAGGGIISSINAVRKQSPIEMEKQLLERAKKFLECGTTTA